MVSRQFKSVPAHGGSSVAHPPFPQHEKTATAAGIADKVVSERKGALKAWTGKKLDPRLEEVYSATYDAWYCPYNN